MTDDVLLKKIVDAVALEIAPLKEQLVSQATDIHAINKDLRTIRKRVIQHTELLEGHTIDILVIRSTLEEHTSILKDHTTRLKGLKKKLNKATKDISVAIETFDRRIVHNTKDIAQIKTSIGLPTS